jgi:response regulator of citrate/malate metabolism
MNTGQPSQKQPLIAIERHYSVQEIAEMWNISTSTVRRIFRGQDGVLEIGAEETRYGRPHRVMRIPESVLVRVHGKGGVL